MTRFRLRSIGSKILIRTTLVVLLPLIALSAIVLVGLDQLGRTAEEQVAESRAQLSRESVAVNAQDQSVSVAREVNATLLERVADVTGWTRNPTVIEGAKAGNDLADELGLTSVPIDDLEDDFSSRKSTGVAPEAERFLNDEIEIAPEYGEVFFTDANGFNAGLTDLTSDFVQSDEDWWQAAWNDGISVSDVEFDESADTYSVDIAARIDDPSTGEALGVMKASLAVDFVQSITTARSIGNTDYTVTLPDGRLIAETSTFHDDDRLMTELPDEEIPEGVLQAIEQGGAGALVTEETVFGYTRTTDANFLGEQIRGFKGLDWIVVSSQQANVAFAPLRGLETLSDEIDTASAGLRGSVTLAVVIAAVIAVVISRLLARSIVHPIRRLTAAASTAATTSLPNAVIQIDQAGGDLDSVEVPEIQLHTGDELERLARSFNSVQGTAVRLAAEQALDRRNTADMFVNLGRRNNSLLKRQLRFIDGLERNEADPETLDSLYKLDHLATRMRRNAESLLVLAGERSPRRWSARVPMKDAVQSALAEVEEYERADLDQIDPGTVQGNVVADFAHILAELIENALTFSPPQTNVVVNGWQNEDDSYTLTVSDRGIGMRDEELAAANDRLSTTFDLSQVPAQHIGLFVVGRLARQHDIEVSLSRSPTGGTTATIELPAAIASEAGETITADPGDTTANTSTADTSTTDTPTAAETPTVADTTEDGGDLTETDTPAAAAPKVSATDEAAPGNDSIEAVPVEEAAADSSTGEAASIEAEPDEPESASEEPPLGEQPPSEESVDHTVNESSSESGGEEQPATDHQADRGDELAVPSAKTLPARPRRVDDAPFSQEASGRRGPDDPPVESVSLGDFEVPRRRSSGPRPDKPKPTMTASDASAGDGPPAGEDPDPKLNAYGFTKRRRGQDAAASPGQAAMVAKVDADDDVEATAEQSRSQWSSFQRGKQTAESEPSESTESALPDEQGA